MAPLSALAKDWAQGFGAWLREQRIALNLSQRELGLEVGGVHRNTIDRWERGRGVPSAYEYMLIRQFVKRKTGRRVPSATASLTATASAG